MTNDSRKARLIVLITAIVILIKATITEYCILVAILKAFHTLSFLFFIPTY